MDDFSLLIDLHHRQPRQGPGGDRETALALALSGLKGRTGLKIADIGCGTGASTLVLATALDATITAVDLFPAFLGTLDARAGEVGLSDKILTLSASMEALPFEEGSLDASWSEGAIYNLGFAKGAALWRPLLKSGGVLAVSELTWLTKDRPDELTEHWHKVYPEVDTASAKLHVLEAAGYEPLGYFPLPERCWLENYYDPIEAGFEAFLARHHHSDAARALVDAEQREISLYRRYSDYVSYGFYIARRL